MTSSSRRRETLSLRLQKLRDLQRETEVIWDIGCDHGLLGTSFENEPHIKEINLVDPSLEVVAKLKDSYISNTKIKVINKKGQELSLGRGSKTIFIAGMGGKEIGEIIRSLLPELTPLDQLIISPHRKILELREFLSSTSLGCFHEDLVYEGGQYYQILGLSLRDDLPKVSLYGDLLWQSKDGPAYREHQVKFFSLHKDEDSVRYVEHLRGLKCRR